MADLISASSLTQAPELIGELGGDPADIFERVGIDPTAVGMHDQFVPFSSLGTLLGLCAREFAAPDFALRLAARQSPDILGPLAIVARNAETLGDALREVTDFTHVYSPAMTTHLRVNGTDVAYEFRTLPRRLPYRDHLAELALGVTLSTFRMLGGDDFPVTRVAFTHPAIARPEVYREYFDCPVEFDAPANLLLFPRGLLQRRPPGIDPLAHDIAIRFMAGRDRATSFPDVVSSVVVRALPAGAATLGEVAELMMMHPRALQRRLAESGTTFEHLVDETRREIALGLLANRSVPLATIAQQLGYSEQSTLTRSCRRWFGATPLGKRRELTITP
ncbi:AraC family transcriptional regulator [Rhodococcus sp. C26F]